MAQIHVLRGYVTYQSHTNGGILKRMFSCLNTSIKMYNIFYFLILSQNTPINNLPVEELQRSFN